jgi:hypothetical protein
VQTDACRHHLEISLSSPPAPAPALLPAPSPPAPGAQWYYVAGCDTYLLPANLLRALDGLDPQQRLVVGGHAGMHFDTLFLSGGSGLVFSQVGLCLCCSSAPCAALATLPAPSFHRAASDSALFRW